MTRETIGIVVVDHGSRRQESNALLLQVVVQFQEQSGYEIVEPAHMELAEPSIHTAFGRCVERGANLVIVHPFFLLPGRHWDEDIPALTAAAARDHKDIRFLVTAPLGTHSMMPQVMTQCIQHCLAHGRGEADVCDACADTDKCQIEVVGLQRDPE